MNTILKQAICLLMLTVLFGTGQAGELQEIEGVFGFNRITNQTYLAVWVPIENGSVVTGVRWYQNDGTTVFPEILAQAGLLSWPCNISETVPLVQNVAGQTSSWSEVVFPQPITADSAGLYLFFRLQEGAAFLHYGAGGGFGLGHYSGDGVRSCWLTGNGEDWNPMDANHKMAVDPILASDKSVGEVLVLKFVGGAVDTQPSQVAPLTASLTAFPNPFNPQTKLDFVVPKSGFVKLGVYDLRGRKVRELVSTILDAGKHSATWDGCSTNGQPTASGVYFARFSTGGLVLSKQLVLLK